MAAAADTLERKAGLAAAIPADTATLAGKRIPADAAIPAGSATPVAAAILADRRIPVAAAILADSRIPAVVATPADEATRAEEATTVGATMIAAGAGGIEAVGALASGTTRHLTRTAPAIPISRTIAIPTATTISGATGILQRPAASPTSTRDTNAAAEKSAVRTIGA